ncbi:MAG: hypothetical protein ACI8ZN_002660, partial [Bacteroidia bacterium]
MTKMSLHPSKYVLEVGFTQKISRHQVSSLFAEI